MNPLHFAVAVAASLSSLTAFAQVYRCTSPSGGVEYSQVPCGKDAQLLQSRKDSIDRSPPRDPFAGARERERGREAYERAYNAQASAPRSGGAQEREIDAAACARADRSARIEANHASKDRAEIRRKQQLADWECGRNITAAAAPTDKRAQVVPGNIPPPSMASCDAAGCWDTQGGRYNRGAGDTYFGPGGTACTRTAGGMVCP